MASSRRIVCEKEKNSDNAKARDDETDDTGNGIRN